MSLAGLAWVPLAVDAVRGLVMWAYRMYSLYVLNEVTPYRIAAHAHDTTASWFAWCSAELRVTFLLSVLVTPRMARLHACSPDGHGGRDGQVQQAGRRAHREPFGGGRRAQRGGDGQPA